MASSLLAASSSSSNMIQLHLQRALEEVESRQQVQTCLSDMITNIEWAAQCNQEVQTKQTQEALAQALTNQSLVLQETELVQQNNEEQRQDLAMNLIKEMYKISQDLGELYQLRQDHQDLSQNYDELVAKLLQAEERIQFMQEGGSGTGESANANSNSNNSNNNDNANPPSDDVTKDNNDNNNQDNNSSTTGATDDETKIMSSTAPPVPTLNDDDDDAVPSLIRPKATTTDNSTDGGGELPNVAVSNNDAAAAAAATTTVTKTEATATEEADNKPETNETGSSSTTTPSTSTQQQTDEVTTATATTAADPASSSAVANNEQTSASQEPLVESSEPAPAAAVVMVEQDDEEAPRLETLDTQALMHVFGYLDALDILNTAQVNISMYSRVDTLFGLGDAPGMEGDNSTIATADSNVQAPPAPEPAPTIVQPPPATTAAAKPPPPAPAPTIVRPPSLELTPKQGTTTAPAAAAAAAATSGTHTPTPIQGLERTIFGFLQPRKSPQPNTVMASPTPNAPTPTMGNTPTSSARRSPRPQAEPAPMNAAMANSMASKLTDAELNAIIHMTERLRNKEAQLDQLHNENERLAAELDGTDAVKQFLVAKVRSMEESLSQTVDQEAKVAQQIASDQEVIAFLDGRVQELERSLSSSKMETESLQIQWQTYQTQAEQKATVLTDMLRFERERVQETQSEFKATKKLLVKEVKSCRAQIMALTAESRALSQENETLKRALMHGNPPPSPGRPSYTKRVSAS